MPQPKHRAEGYIDKLLSEQLLTQSQKDELDARFRQAMKPVIAVTGTDLMTHRNIYALKCQLVQDKIAARHAVWEGDFAPDDKERIGRIDQNSNYLGNLISGDTGLHAEWPKLFAEVAEKIQTPSFKIVNGTVQDADITRGVYRTSPTQTISEAADSDFMQPGQPQLGARPTSG